MDTELRIGEVAKRAGVTIDTLRYYEKVKLLPTPTRSSGGFRLFAPEHIERVRFIKQAQELGFSLGEIRGLLAIFSVGRGIIVPQVRQVHRFAEGLVERGITGAEW